MRKECEVAGAAVSGATLGYVGASIGAQAGFAFGITLSPVSHGLPGMLTWAVNGARFGMAAGALAGLAGGIALGAWGAAALYDRYHGA
ncbi:MAG: hypothetical protein ACYCW6_04415 [Candidatus Xenobia bacterium]